LDKFWCIIEAMWKEYITQVENTMKTEKNFEDSNI
jgi:hypothetical protein